MSSTPTDQRRLEDHPVADGPLPELLDWVLGAIVALAGLIAIVGSSALVFLVDRDVIAEGIEDDAVTVTVFTTELTDAEAVDLANAVVTWTGFGLAVTGLGMLAFAVWFVVGRHRTHRRARAGEPVSSYSSFAVLGAVTAAFLSFIPLSPVLGGALAGYLERGESARIVSVGAVSGLLAVLPLLALLTFTLVGVVAGLLAVDQIGAGVVVGAAMVLGGAFVAAVGVGLGALGGYVGGTFAERRAKRSDRRPPAETSEEPRDPERD